MDIKKRRDKIKRSTWLPTLLLIYLLAMTAWFAPSLIDQGETVRLITVFVAELMVIAVLHVFLKRRERQNR